MCVDPVTALMVGSTLLGGVGQVQAAQAQSASQTYSAKVAERNATQADLFAKDALERGAVAEAQQRREGRALLGQQRAILASRNIDPSQGTSVQIVGDTAAFNEMDALSVRNNFEREALGFTQQGRNFRDEASGARAAAKDSTRAGMLGAATTALGGASDTLQYRARRRMTL